MVETGVGKQYKWCDNARTPHAVVTLTKFWVHGLYKVYSVCRPSPSYAIFTFRKRRRWSRGTVLAFGTHVRKFKPDRSRWIFQGEKILNAPSFGGAVKPSVPCRNLRHVEDPWMLRGSRVFSGKIYRPFLAHVVPPLAARISRRRLVTKVGTLEKIRRFINISTSGR